MSALVIVATIAGTLGFFMGFLSLFLVWRKTAAPSERLEKLFLDFLGKTGGERKFQPVAGIGRKPPDFGGAGFILGDTPCANTYGTGAGSPTGAALRAGEIRGMVATGMSLREIAERMNMPRGEIDLILKLR
jgi:hypothetical protein